MTEPIVLSPKEKVIKEIEDAVKYGELDNIFKKMITNEDDYKKYYFELHMKFRGYAVMRLKKQSIIKDIIDKISLHNVQIEGMEKLKYGYMPLLFHFIMNGFAWNTFQGARNEIEYLQVTACFDDVVEQLQKEKASKYNDQEYDEMVIEACEYVDPDTYENTIHVATHYLCERVIEEIKSAYKSDCRRNLIKLHGGDAISAQRISLGEDEFNKILSVKFDKLLNETTKENKKAIDLFNERKEKKQEAIDKYTEKCQKAISRSRGNQVYIDEANERLDYNLNQLDKNIHIFYNRIFNMNCVNVIKIQKYQIDYDRRFCNLLAKLAGFTNKYGTKYEIIELTLILKLVNTELKSKKDDYMKQIIDKIPETLLNPMPVIETFKGLQNIDYLWNSLLNSISFEKPETNSFNLLDAFFREDHKGLRESYICQYLEKLSMVSSKLSDSDKKKFIDNIEKSVLSKEIKQMIIL